ncbi:hypothetical protein FG386_002644 [Cryptosporidium ryanae]|uniref:uncharacterized protein n=1 Tax=Cryptosporidium ryanae TaxID=515981 RepID=UPI00351A4A9D|nr:hypothetical protein FG386_002644 [Cryptosporidium ryanae]
MDSAEILFCLLDSLDNCDLATEASVYSTVVDFAKSNTSSSNCVGLVSNAIISFLQVSHTSINHQLSLLRLLSLIISSYAISDDVVLEKNDDGEIVNKLEIVNATNFTINEISQEDVDFFDNLSKFIVNEYVCLKQTDPRRVALLQVIISLVFLIPENLVETLLRVIQDTRISNNGGISSILVAISAISKMFPEIVSKKGHDIIVELLSLLHKVAKNDSSSKNILSNNISRVELVRCLAGVADALRSNYIEMKSFAGLVGTAFDALLNDWVPTIQKDKDVFYLSFPTLETLGHLAQVIDDEQLIQHAPKLLSVYLQILNSLLSKKNKYFPTLISTFSETCKDSEVKFDDLLPNNIYTLRWRQYHSTATSVISPLLTNKSEVIPLSLHYSILSGFKLFLDRCHTVCRGVFEDQNNNNSLFNVLIQYCATFHRLYAPAILPGYIAHLNNDEEVVLEKELFESENGYLCNCWNYSAIHDIITTHYELILCWKTLITQDLTRETALKFLFDNIDIKSANRLSSMFVFRHIVVDLPFEKLSNINGKIITISENSDTALGNLLYRLARTTLEQGLDYCIAFILSDIICELAKYKFLHIGSYEQSELDKKNWSAEELSCSKFTWVSPSPSSAEMLTYFLRLLAVPESKAKGEHMRHIQRHKNDHLKNNQNSEGVQMPVIYPPSLWDLRNNAQYILSEELTSLVPDLLWPLLIDAVNHLKLGSAMPIVCESLCKSCNSLYERSTPDVFFSAFKHQGSQYLSVSDPYKIFVWLCMYAHDPYVYNGILAYWSLRCLKWIAPMIMPSVYYNWSCLPSQKLQNVIEIAESVIVPIKIADCNLNRNESNDYSTVQTKHDYVKYCETPLSSNINIDLWFTLVDECISLILSGMSGCTSEMNFDEEDNFCSRKTGSQKYKTICINLMGVLNAIFSACKDIRSDKIQKNSDTPTEIQRAGMYSSLGLLLREVSKDELCMDCIESSDLKLVIEKFILKILDGVLIPELATYNDSNVTGIVSSAGNTNNSVNRVGDDFKNDILNSNDMSLLKDLSRHISDLQHFFHAIGLNTSVLQTSCGRGIGYASSNNRHFILISEYLLELIKSDSANKRSGAFSFFGKSLAVLQAEQLRSALLLSLGHAIGETSISIFNSSIDTIKRILAVLESAIKEEKEPLLHCSTLKAIQVAFSAFSLIENNEITLSSRINSIMNKSHSGDGFRIFGEHLNSKDASIELFNSFRDTIFPYILTTIVFSETIELPPVPLDSTLLLKAASGMPYNTSSSISSQRIHTDPSGPYIRSMVKYRDISISNLDLMSINDSDSSGNISGDEAQSRSHSMRISRNPGYSYLEKDYLLFGPFNLTLAVLSVLSDNPLMSSDNNSDIILSEDFLKLLMNGGISNASLKNVSNLGYMKSNNYKLGINDKINYVDCNFNSEPTNSILDKFSNDGGSLSKASKTKSNSILISSDTINETNIESISQSHLKSNNNQNLVGEIKEYSATKELKTNEFNSGNVRILNSRTHISHKNNKNQPSSLISHSVGSCIANQSISAGNIPINSFSTSNNLGSSNLNNTNNTNNLSINNNNSTVSVNPATFNNLLLYALETLISLISFPSPLIPQHIPLVINSCLTILVSVSSRIKFRCINEDFLSGSHTKNYFSHDLIYESFGIIDGGFKLKEMMNIIEDTLTQTNSSDVSAFSILDSLDRLYLNIYKSHMPSWVGLSHLLEGLLGLGATANSPVLRCLCIHITYCLVCEAPLVEILKHTQIDIKDGDCVNRNNSDMVLPPKGTWVSWMHCVALILGRTCDSCIYVRLIAFECIKECMKRCVWTQSIDLSQLRTLEFEDEIIETLKSINSGQLRAVLIGNMEIFGDENRKNRLFSDRDASFSDIQSMILPHTYLNLLLNLANNIPAFCLRPLCQHILPSFHDVDRVTAYSSVETVRVFFAINDHILESESFSTRIISSLFEEISAIKDNELQHFVYLLIRNVVSRQFQSGINEIFNKCIQPRRYINYGHLITDKNEEYVENIILSNSGGKESEWTTIDMIDSVKDSVLKQSDKNSNENEFRNIINIICTVNPIYSKAISYIGRDKVLLLESFRYLTDILNNTEQKYHDIMEMNERLCLKIASLVKIDSKGGLLANILDQMKDSFSPNLNVSYPLNISKSGVHQFQTYNELFIPISTLSSLSNEHIYLRSSTLTLDILLQTNDSGIRIIAKKHFPELISTLLLRCCSTLGYINMGALESSNTLRSLFLALYDVDALLTFFDANKIELSLIRSDEFDSAIIKLLCYIFTQRPSISKSVFTFIRPFLDRVDSIYSMGAIILLSPVPLGIYINDFSNSSKIEDKKEELIGLYDQELLEAVLNVIKISNNPYAKKNGFVFFQWYFWFCLESNIFPKEEFILKYINICFINVIGNSTFKNDIKSSNLGEPLEIYKIGTCEKNINLDLHSNKKTDLYKDIDYYSSNDYSSGCFFGERDGSTDEGNLGVFSSVINDNAKKDKIGDLMVSTSFIDSERKSDDLKSSIKEIENEVETTMLSSRSLIRDLIRECIISLRYLVCIISIMDLGLPLLLIPNHPPINLEFKANTNIFIENKSCSIYMLFITYLFSSNINDKMGHFKQVILNFGENKINIISEIFMDFITNSDFGVQVTTEKLYLLLDILILIKRKWGISKPDKNEVKLIKLCAKKLLIPLLVRLEEPTLKLTRPVWRAIQLILSIILTDYEWNNVVNEIKKKFILDGLIVKNSMSSPLSATMSPSSFNKRKLSKSFSGFADKNCCSDSIRKQESKNQEEKCTFDIKNVDLFTSPYNSSTDNDGYKFILPKNYRRNINSLTEYCNFIGNSSSDDIENNFNSFNKFVQIKYSGECEFLNRFLLPILNPVETNNYQQFLNCIIPFIISSDILRDTSDNLKHACKLSENSTNKVSNVTNDGLSNLSEELNIIKNKNISKLDIIKPTLKELGRRIEDCHLYLNRCRYYFPIELWEITETTFSTIPKELDRIRKEAETQHLLFNRNIFGEMVNNNIGYNEGVVGTVFNKSFLNKDLEFPSNFPETGSSRSRFSFSYSPSSGIIPIPSFAKIALSHFNTLWGTGKNTSNKIESGSHECHDPEILSVNLSVESMVAKRNILNLEKPNNPYVDFNKERNNLTNEHKTNILNDKSKDKKSNFGPLVGIKLPDALSQQLDIKKMELISEYIKYPAALRSLERYYEKNEETKVSVEGTSAILASTFIKYISIEFFQHLYTSETLMLLAYREIYDSGSSNTDGKMDELRNGEALLENEILMNTIDKLLSLESLISAICKQISSFVAQSQSPSRHRFAKALANLVYISYKP